MTIRRKFREWLLQDDSNAVAIKQQSSSAIRRLPNFIIKTYTAVGGTIIEIHKVSQEERFDDSESKLYIISDKQEFGESLAKILTLEALR